MTDRLLFTNGCFDLLHIGHIRFLQACKELGGYLVVGINSDSSVSRLKGSHRPIIPEWHRKEMLLALDCVDEVMVFVEDTPLELMRDIEPNVFIKSTEYQYVALPEFAYMHDTGGQIVLIQPHPDLAEVKTSKIVDKIFTKEYERRLGK